MNRGEPIGWAWSRYEEEGFHGPFATRDEAIAAAASELDDDESRYVAVAYAIGTPQIGDILAGEAVERAEEAIYDQTGIDEITLVRDRAHHEQLAANLQAVFAAWYEQIGGKVYFTVDSIEWIEPTPAGGAL